MPLPQQVIERLSHEPVKTPGWSFGILLFSGGVLLITVLVYFGLILGYEPYLDSQISSSNTQSASLASSISTSDQAKLITFYSQVANVKAELANHVMFSHFLAWLAANTEANITFSSMSFASGNQISLAGAARSEADVNQQAAIFESSPAVKNMALSGASFSATTGFWQFSVVLTMKNVSATL